MGVSDSLKDGYSEFSVLNLNFLAYSYHDKVQISLGMLVDEQPDMVQHPREPRDAPWAASRAAWPAGRGRGFSPSAVRPLLQLWVPQHRRDMDILKPAQRRL